MSEQIWLDRPHVSRGPFSVNALVAGRDENLLFLPDCRQIDLTREGLNSQDGGMSARLGPASQSRGQKNQAQPSH